MRVREPPEGQHVPNATTYDVHYSCCLYTTSTAIGPIAAPRGVGKNVLHVKPDCDCFRIDIGNTSATRFFAPATSRRNPVSTYDRSTSSYAYSLHVEWSGTAADSAGVGAAGDVFMSESAADRDGLASPWAGLGLALGLAAGAYIFWRGQVYLVKTPVYNTGI